MPVWWVIDESRVQVCWAQFFWWCKNSLNFKGDLFLVIVSNGFQICVENLHVFSVKDFSIVHCDYWLVTSNLYQYATFIKTKTNDIGIFSWNSNTPTHTQIVLQSIQKRMISRMMN